MYRIELIIRETMAKFTYLTYIGVQIHKQVHNGIFTKYYLLPDDWLNISAMKRSVACFNS